ncbi:hypothetical protein EDD21DRAFT_125430 [Dissophora ornata]|nr:hypothetical protein EDD21DRAFT_125430 [Dissophora ornata]
MALSATAVKPKKKRTVAVALGCDQCRRRKTKCDQARPTCGPCLYAGLMECTFLLGKPPAPKRKKAQTEVEILEARLETIESAYSERLSQMESLLNRVMPGAHRQDLAKLSAGPPIAPIAPAVPLSPRHHQGAASTNDGEWVDIDSPQEDAQPSVANWDRPAANASVVSAAASNCLIWHLAMLGLFICAADILTVFRSSGTTRA